MQKEKLPFKVYLVYGIGCFGWSISLNIISVLLNYVYLPPNNSGMVDLIPQIAFFGFINIISIILFTGRAFDAVVDPLLANLTDQSTNKLGRRIPFLRWSFLPMSLFSVLIFFPPFRGLSNLNIYWLAVIQVFYYFFFGMYTIPYNALLADIGHNAKEKLRLSTAQSVGFMVGALFSSSTTVVVMLLLSHGITSDRLTAYQISIIALNILAATCMAAPAFFLDEKKYASKANSTGTLWENLKAALSNHNFRIFALADACYFMSIAIISAGLLYYVKSMLRLDEALGTGFLLCLVAITLLFYILVSHLSKTISKKKMMVAAFAAAAVVFFEVFFLGRFPLPPVAQAGILVLTFGIPNAFLQILPTTVVADIAHDDLKRTGQNKEGMFFGMRAFFQKIGQTGGVTLFAMLTLYGKDPGNDFGLRLTGIAGAGLCAIACLAYTQYREE